MFYTVNHIKQNLYHIADPMGVFMTLIVGNEKALLLDTGYGVGRLDETIAQITGLPLIVVNSHGHLDHVLGNCFFHEIHLHPADVQLYQRHTTSERKQSVAMMWKDHPERFPADFSPEAYIAGHRPEIVPIDDGDVFDLGGVKLTVVHVPGHTQGGIALLDDRDRLLLGGDTVSPHVWLFLQESTDIETYIRSLQKLQGLDSRYDGIIAAHVPDILPNDLVGRLMHCAENIDQVDSVHFIAPFEDAGQGTMYFEGLESLKTGLKVKTLDFEKQPFYTLDLGGLDFSRLSFVSIVYKDQPV